MRPPASIRLCASSSANFSSQSFRLFVASRTCASKANAAGQSRRVSRSVSALYISRAANRRRHAAVTVGRRSYNSDILLGRRSQCAKCSGNVRAVEVAVLPAALFAAAFPSSTMAQAAIVCVGRLAMLADSAGYRRT